jgi:hypothetical protein
MYINTDGIFAGNSDPSQASFWLDILGNLVATSATISGKVISGSATGQRIELNPTTEQIEIYDSTNTLIGEIGPAVGGGWYMKYVFSGSGPGYPGSVLLTSTDSVLFAPYGTSTTAGLYALDTVSANSMYLKVLYNELVVEDEWGNPLMSLLHNGNWAVSGTKAFDIPHPDGTPDKRLKYIATESPEVLLICRGKGGNPKLPQHFIEITEPDSIQYVIGDDGSGEKNWFATGVRKGYANFEPEYFTEAKQGV